MKHAHQKQYKSFDIEITEISWGSQSSVSNGKMPLDIVLKCFLRIPIIASYGRFFVIYVFIFSLYSFSLLHCHSFVSHFSLGERIWHLAIVLGSLPVITFFSEFS